VWTKSTEPAVYSDELLNMVEYASQNVVDRSRMFPIIDWLTENEYFILAGCFEDMVRNDMAVRKYTAVLKSGYDEERGSYVLSPMTIEFDSYDVIQLYKGCSINSFKTVSLLLDGLVADVSVLKKAAHFIYRTRKSKQSYRCLTPEEIVEIEKYDKG